MEKTKSRKFSKAKLLKALRTWRDEIEDDEKFDPDAGHVQVDGEGDAKNRAYGAWEVINDIVVLIEHGDLGCE